MIPLWDFQEDLGVRARKSLRKHRSSLIVLPTGGGKSYITAWMIANGLSKDKTFYFCVHRKDLLTQMASTFKKFGIPFGFIAAGKPYNSFQPVQICSVQTLHNRIDSIPAPSVLIVDEAHFSCSKTYSHIIDSYKARGSYIIGKTATPWRMSGEGLGRHFDDMVVGPTVSELMERGFLSDYKLYAPSAPDLTGVHTKMGDYVKSEIEGVMDKTSITGNAVTHYQKYASGKRAVAFCVSIKHSKHVAENFKSAGIMALHVDGETPARDRMAAFKAFADGHVKILTSVSIFSEGLDLASLIERDVQIEAAILLRPTQSLSMYLQQVGRALRKKDNPAIILDHAANYTRHGLPDDDREWSLNSNKKKKSSGNEESDIAVKQCPVCFAVHRPSAVCPECGHVYEIKYRKIEELEGELNEVDVEEERRRRRAEQGGAKSVKDLAALGARRGYKNPEKWARYVYNARKAKEMMP